MSFLRVVIRKDLDRIRRDPASLAISLLIPLFIGVMIKMLSGDGGQPTARLLVADQDGTFLSGFLTGALGQGPLEDLIVAESVEEDEGRRMMDDGEASGLLVIPEGFSDAVFDRRPVALALVTNPSQRILPGILEETLATFVEALNLGGLVLGGDLDPLLDRLRDQKGVPADALVGEFSVSVNRLVRRVEPYLMPPVIELDTVNLDEPAEDVPDRSFADIFFPSMFFLAIVFVAQSLSDDVWKEKTRGTLRRTLTGPGSLPLFFLGKLLAAGCVLLLVSAGALGAARWILLLPFTGIPLAVVWTALSGLFMLLFFTLLQLLASSQRGGNLLSNAVVFPLVMAGGAFFPFEVMPDWLARIGKLTPNGVALVRLREILDGTPDPALLARTLGGLVLLSILFFALSILRIRRFTRSA